MRVVGGQWRGYRLLAPRGTATRPTPERVREALFDILGPSIADARFLDLFAGSGAVGIEAASRGAATVVFVERNRKALECLRRNLDHVHYDARVLAGEAGPALDTLGREGAAFDVIYVDPPYAVTDKMPARIGRAVSALLAPGGTMIVEHADKSPPRDVAGLAKRMARRYGDTCLTLYEKGTDDG
ncbi:MAG: 16S rRNA (guanine(966)-N(2))-methyltransferase RsmD [Deltaproteobacteria bacterium]|nr:16S rRNA (guanine(966)-N(2))-methyltransferase RsmD [Deltaproteobacteria bacterium]